jgi:hypothetical protein
MREGFNRSRHQKVASTAGDHRVIIPLYIPHEEEYYKDAFQIFSLCLKSIKRGAIAEVPITVVANGCAAVTHEKLLDLVSQGWIDELLIVTDQIGKLNSIRKGILASDESFLTITDADVLFLTNWDQAVSQVFSSFPKATAVAPVPIHKTFNQYVSNIWFDHLISNKIAFAKAKNPEALESFVKSIGWPHLNDHQKLEILTLTANDGTEAVVGCSHFCTTYRREIFQFAPQEPTPYTLGGNSEEIYLDIPSTQSNGYRLSTATNHAFHSGNVFEPWMQEEFDAVKDSEKKVLKWPEMRTLKKSYVSHFLKNKIFKKLMSYPYFYNTYLKKCGLNKEWAPKFFK